ncbi:MAG: SecDF P1 head subdomain-containing protein [Verrucomicrobiales bacterium]
MKFFHGLFVILFLTSVTPLWAGGKKQPEVGLAFHTETEGGENPKMVFTQFVSGQERVFRRVPEVTSKDIQAFNPFPSQDGQGFGVLLKLKPGAINRWAAVTASNSGKWMVSRVNGRIVDAVRIDQQVSDGEIVIWKGLSISEVNQMDKSIPRIGEDKPRG